jgi:hypothetical protein
MTAAAGSLTVEPSASSVEAGCGQFQSRAALERERLRIQAEIVSYPMPIPACDVYFNGLLEQRARICEALSRLDPQERHGDR